MKDVSNTTPVANGFVDRSRHAIAIGLVASVLLVGGFGSWAASAKLSGAVVTHGKVVVASDLKMVQHPDGGIVGAIHVKNGDRVAAGDVVLTLDDALLKANRTLVDDQLVALDAKLARLTAERDGRTDLELSEELAARRGEDKIDHALAAQRAVMDARKMTFAGEASALREQIAQRQQEIDGLTSQRKAKDEEVALIEDELVGLDTLYNKGLVPKTRITALKRERTALLGASGSLSSQIAVARGRISEIQLQILQLEKTTTREVMSEISSLLPQMAQLKERRAAADLQLARVDVRAPVDGIVHELSAHTVGGVVAAGQTLMQLVPDADTLVVSANVAPEDINNVTLGQASALVISAFDQKVLPRLDSTVTFVSPDLKTDPATGISSYEVRVTLDDNAAVELADRNLALLPGMPAEVYMATGERTMANYLLDPLAKQIRNTFREP
ncbi:MAG: HlyD family type I secretion periplasmic adaptor subunit [Devosia sp.]